MHTSPLTPAAGALLVGCALIAADAGRHTLAVVLVLLVVLLAVGVWWGERRRRL